MRIESLEQLAESEIVMLDRPGRRCSRLRPRMPPTVRRPLLRYRHGPGAFKVEFAVQDGVPWTYEPARRAGTVDLGGDLVEITATEKMLHLGQMPERPYVLVCQQSLADPSRARDGIHPIYSYAHVPNGYTGDATIAIEAQIERFAPGFRERVLARHIRSTTDMSAHNANYVGGDIVTGANDPLQLIFRPRAALDPYSLGIPGIYLCSAATPPGAGAHACRLQRRTVCAACDRRDPRSGPGTPPPLGSPNPGQGVSGSEPAMPWDVAILVNNAAVRRIRASDGRWPTRPAGGRRPVRSGRTAALHVARA